MGIGSAIIKGGRKGLSKAKDVVVAHPKTSGVVGIVGGLSAYNKLSTPDAPVVEDTPAPVTQASQVISIEGLPPRPPANDAIPSGATTNKTTTTVTRKASNDVQIAVPDPVIPDTSVRTDTGNLDRKGMWKKFGAQVLTGDEARAAGLIPKDSTSDVFVTNQPTSVAGFDFSRTNAAVEHNANTPTGKLKSAQREVLDIEDELSRFKQRKIDEALQNQPQYAVAKELLPKVLALATQGDEAASKQVLGLQQVINSAESHASEVAVRSLATNIPLNRRHKMALNDLAAAKKSLLDNTQTVTETASNKNATSKEMQKIFHNPVVKMLSLGTGKGMVESAQLLKSVGKSSEMLTLLVNASVNNGALGLNRAYGSPEVNSLNAQIMRGQDVTSSPKVVDDLVTQYKLKLPSMYEQAKKQATEAEAQRKIAAEGTVTKNGTVIKNTQGVSTYVKPTKEEFANLVNQQFMNISTPRIKAMGLNDATNTSDPIIARLVNDHDITLDDVEAMLKERGDNVGFGKVFQEYRDSVEARYRKNREVYSNFFVTESEVNARLQQINGIYQNLYRKHISVPQG